MSQLNPKKPNSSKVKDILKKGLPTEEKYYFRTNQKLSFFENQVNEPNNGLFQTITEQQLGYFRFILDKCLIFWLFFKQLNLTL